MDPERQKDTLIPTMSRRPGIKICPRCGSMDVDATTGTGYVSPPLYVCNRCGFSGSIFPELDREEALKHAKSAESGVEGVPWDGEAGDKEAEEEGEGSEKD